jgi:glycosyltransferase involved in cell wall biosynthesis
VLFSIIIPTHNRLKSLIDALESVFQQTVEDYEVIVVDDGSQDGTEQAVLEMLNTRAIAQSQRESQMCGLGWATETERSISGNAEPVPAGAGGEDCFMQPEGQDERERTSQKLKLKYIRQENKGPGAARNLGASVARGEYLAFLDSDDLWFPWSLETYREVIAKENCPGFVAGYPFVFERKEQVDAVAKGYLETKRFADYLESGDERRWWGVSSFVVKKSLFDRVGGFAPEFVNGEDADFVMKCGVEPGFVQVVSPFTFGYRKHEANITKAFDKNLAGARLQIRNEKSGVYPGGKSRARERWHILSRQIRPVAVAALENRRPDAAWEIYKATFWWHLALQKWKFLIGLPLAMAWRACARR